MFVEDTVVVDGDLAVIARPGADERKPETAGTEAALAALGYRIVRIEPPGTLDGGDVLEHAGVVCASLARAVRRHRLARRHWPSLLEVPEEAGAHVVVLDDETVLMSASAPATRELFESRGLRVVAVELSEYEKLEGWATCLSVRLR